MARSARLCTLSAAALLLVLASAVPRGQSQDASLAKAETVVKEILRRTSAPAVQAAVVRRGEIVFSHAEGVADVEHRVRASTASRFRIGSVSKALTAAAAVRLAERAALDLDAAVSKYVPAFPDKGRPITIRQLLTHMGGIRHYAGDEFSSATRYATVTEALKIFATDPVVAPPGSKPVYSTYGYVLLSAALETAAGRPFLQLMDEEVFRPLNLRSTVPDFAERIIPDRAGPYVRTKEGVVENAPFVDNSNKWAGGGFLSTAEDLARFGALAFTPGYLQKRSVELMLTPAKTDSGEPTIYGFGVRLQMEKERLVYAHHGGSSIGGRGFLYIEPESGLAVAFTANLFSGIDEKDARTLADIFR